MGGCRCSYKTCKSATKTHQELHFFHYPVKTRDRCMQWIHNANRMEFSYLPNDQLRNKVVCGLHFHESCFTNELRKRLVHDAVPTLDIGCDPEKVEVSQENLNYLNMQQDIDDMGEKLIHISHGGVATIKATSGDGNTFSLDTEPYEIPDRAHLVTYNFINGSLVPSVTSTEDSSSASASASRNGNTAQADNTVVSQYSDYTSIFGIDDDPTVQYITADSTVVQSSGLSRQPRSGRAGQTTTSTATSSTSRDSEDMESFVLSYVKVQDPLANDDDDADQHAVINIERAGRHHQDHDQLIEDCEIQVETEELGADMDMREIHILPAGSNLPHSFNDSIDDCEQTIMVSAEEIVPDNSRQITELIDISADDDDDDDVIIGSGSLFDGDAEIELTSPVRAQPVVHVAQSRVQKEQRIKQQPTVMRRVLIPAKERRAAGPLATKNKSQVVRVQQTDIIRPQVSISAMQRRQTQHQPQQQQQHQQQQQQQIGLKKNVTYVTTAQTPPVRLATPTVTRIAMPNVNPQRTTTFIKSTMPPQNTMHIRPNVPKVLRTEIQQIIKGNGRNQQYQQQAATTPNPAPVQANAKIVVANTPISSQSPARRRDISTSLAALRSELPASMYSAISIHLQRKRGFFDPAETNFLTTLYSSTPKGYTTLRNKLGWHLPDEDTVKDLLEETDN